MLPNLLIIGAAKCGTTSLHEYLGLHPDVGMSSRKELKFFTRDDWHSRRDLYERQFPMAPVRGESSPGYTMFPFLPSVAERAHELVPDAKLIYLVRDPVERAIASYVEFYALGFEERPIAAALSDVDTPQNPHLCASRYATQLERYLPYFDRDQILVLDQEDLMSRRSEVLREIFAFLGVDPSFETAGFEALHNTRHAKVRYNELGYWLVRRGIFTQRRASLRRGPLIRPLRRLLSRPIDGELPWEVRALLAEAFEPEIQRLTEWTGRTFSWVRRPADAGTSSAPRVPPA